MNEMRMRDESMTILYVGDVVCVHSLTLLSILGWSALVMKWAFTCH